ncbi:MAG: preprotein translocase subunit SecA, partial [Halothiobacillus sp. 20-53-49]
GQEMPLADWLASDKDLHAETLFEKILATLEEDYSVKEAIVGADSLRQFEKGILLQVLDSHWKEHLAAMDYLRQSIGLRGYAQKNPTQEYKREAFEMFSRMLDELNLNVVKVLSRLTIAPNPVTGETVLDDLLDEVVEAQYFDESQLQLRHDSVEEFAEEPRTGADTAPVRVEPKLGRNDLCWCGSGKKYKHCHGKLV